jgi:hypothetical protein
MSIDGPGREQLRALAARLKDAGEEGKGLRREMVKQMQEAVKPLAREIASLAHLEPYMPNRYAGVLADDLTVTTQNLFAGANPRISVVAKARKHKRKLRQLEDGVIVHPVFAQGPRRSWNWKNGRQTAGMKRGFFHDPCKKAEPDIRDHVLKAMSETARKITDGR